MHRGSCICGAVRFTVDAELRAPDACHCVQCRKFSGHYFASTDVLRSALRIDGEEHLRWHHSRPQVRRGFCETCGSSLFWDPVELESIAIAMGAFDGPTGTQLSKHIFVGERGDYYAIADGLPQNQR